MFSFTYRFMTLKKDDKSAKKTNVVYQKPKPTTVVEPVAVEAEETVENSPEESEKTEDTALDKRTPTSEDEDDGSGPSGRRLSGEEREKNLVELWNLQMNLLRARRGEA